MADTKFCKHCGQVIDIDCIICPKCGKQVEQLNMGNRNDQPIIINNNNSASSSASSSAAAVAGGMRGYRKRPWYLSWFWIVIFGFLSSGLALLALIPLRLSWNKGH